MYQLSFGLSNIQTILLPVSFNIGRREGNLASNPNSPKWSSPSTPTLLGLPPGNDYLYSPNDLRFMTSGNVRLLALGPSRGHQRSRQRCAYKQQGEVSLSGGWCGRCACCSASRRSAHSTTQARPYVLELQWKQRFWVWGLLARRTTRTTQQQAPRRWPSQLFCHPPWC